MKLEKYCSFYGAKKRLADRLGIHASSLTYWTTNKRLVPIHWCKKIEDVTNGRVSRKDLRPKDYILIWPELDQKNLSPRQVAPATDQT